MIFFKNSRNELADEVLMKNIGAGDRLSFDELHTRYNERLFYYFYRMLGNCEETANDFLQDIFLKIIDKNELFNPAQSFRKWIFSVAHNMCKNEYRRRETRKIVLQNEFPDTLIDEDSFFSEENKSRWVEIAFQKIDGLSEKSKEILVLKYRENFSLDEIATILEVPKGTVKSRLFYARNELSKVMESIKTKEDKL